MNVEKYYFSITDVWKELCTIHSTLLDQTFDEYSSLLNSELDTLEKTTLKKSKTIQIISSLEDKRSILIKEMKTKINPELIENINIENFGNLLLFFQQNIEEEKKNKHLYKFNALLIDIIEKIQHQNKKNQMFINKALISLDSIKNNFTGSNFKTTYTKLGSTTTDCRL